MLAVDTNIVIRFLTRDDPAQAERARAIFEREDISLLKTVLLECECVLSDSYGFGRKQIATVFDELLALPNVHCDSPEEVANALNWFAHGMDFADALHLASARAAGQFASFDRRLITRARRVANIDVISA